ncbi:hypothetical protein ACEPAI_1651 [Sanghuangporus weigelae]
MCDDPWSRIATVGTSLEILTFTPYYDFDCVFGRNLSIPPSMVALFILADIFYVNLPLDSPDSLEPLIKLPGSLKHLTIIETSLSRFTRGVYDPSLQSAITRLIMMHQIGRACPYLETIHLRGMRRLVLSSLEDLASKAGIKLAITFTVSTEDTGPVLISRSAHRFSLSYS